MKFKFDHTYKAILYFGRRLPLLGPNLPTQWPSLKGAQLNEELSGDKLSQGVFFFIREKSE